MPTAFRPWKVCKKLQPALKLRYDDSRLQRLVWRALLCMALTFLPGACSTVDSARPPENTAAPDTTEPVVKAPMLNSQQVLAIDALLLKGDQALQDRRLLTPISHSAYDYFEAVLSIDSANQEAFVGLEKIVESYLGLALNAARNSQFDLADKLMGRARIAAKRLNAKLSQNANLSQHTPDASTIRQKNIRQENTRNTTSGASYSTDNLDAVASSIRMLRGADRQRLLIERHALKARAEDLAQRLATFGTRAKRPGVRAIILAPSDSAGRWIYQQLRKAPGEYRIRGEIQIGIPAQVELLSIDSAELL